MVQHQIDGEQNSMQGRPAADCLSVDHSLTDHEVAADVQTLATLGNDTQYEALRLIAESDDAVCVCELEPALGVSQGGGQSGTIATLQYGPGQAAKRGSMAVLPATPRAERLLRFFDNMRALEND